METIRVAEHYNEEQTIGFVINWPGGEGGGGIKNGLTLKPGWPEGERASLSEIGKLRSRYVME